MPRPVERFWIAVGTPHPLTSEGWLHEASASIYFSPLSEALTTAQLGAEQCLILLGEPGMGKSTTIENHAPLYNGDQTRIRTLTVDLARYSGEDRLCRTVFEGRVIEQWRTSDDQLVLTLDSFDEAHGRIPTLPTMLTEFLTDCDRSRLSLRLISRTAEWPHSLSLSLGGLFTNVASYELLPLRRTDIGALLPQSIDVDHFLGAAERLHVVPLAARPLTLELLTKAYEKGGALPDKSAELYRTGLLALCDEPNNRRRDTTDDSISTPTERLHIAIRIAAYSIFAGLPTIWTGKVTDADDSDLTTDHIATSSLRSAAAVTETFKTAVFSGDGPERLSWAHATFADFLAASWIVQNQLNEQQQRSLLLAADGKISPRVHQTAAWLVALDPAAAEWLVPADPDAFLLNVDLPNDRARSLVVKTLLREARSGRLFHDYQRNLSNVRHESLDSLLRPALTDPHQEVRRLAVDIARQCQVYTVVPELVQIGLDSSQDRILRVSAVMGVSELAVDDPCHDLLPLIASGGHDEPDDAPQELLGAALLASWPHAIATNDVFAILKPTGPRNYLGLHSSFITDLATSLRPADLHPACRWLQEHALHHGDPRISTLVDSAIALAIRNIDDPLAIAALKDVAYARADEYKELFRADDFSYFDGGATDARRALALFILEDATAEQMFSITGSAGSHEYSLLSSGDLAWVMERLKQSDGRSETNLERAINLLFNPNDREHIDILLDLPVDHPAVRLLSFWRDSVLINSPQANALRDRNRQLETIRERSAHRHSADPAAWVNDKIAKLATRARDGDIDSYWQAVHLVTVRPRTKIYDKPGEADITKHPRWDSLGQDVRDDLIAGSSNYLTHGRCNPHEWLGKDINYHPAEAGYRALVLLLRFQPKSLQALPPEVWTEWAPIIVAWTVAINGANRDDKGALLELALSYAKAELTSALLIVIDKDISNQGHIFRRDEIELLWDDELSTQLLDRLNRPDLNHVSRDSLLNIFMADHAHLVRPLLHSSIEPQFRKKDPESALDAAARLLEHDARESWSLLSELMSVDPEFMKQAALQVGHQFDRTAPDLDEDQLAAAYIFLCEHFPPSDDPTHDDAYFVGPRDSVARWRDNFLEVLTQRGTDNAIEALERIVDKLRDQQWLAQVVLRARRIHRDVTWSPVTCLEIDRIADTRSARLVRSEADLHYAVLDALTGIQTALQGDTPLAPLLWDTYSGRPKTEDEVSDYLRNELQARLHDRGAIVNREVQVRRLPKSGLPERTDIRVDANLPDDSHGLKQLTVVAEVKGAWNQGIVASIETQLVNRYMHDIGSSYGIYVALWYDLESWDDADTRRRAAKSHQSSENLRNTLESTAALLNGNGRLITVVVLDASRTRHANRLSHEASKTPTDAETRPAVPSAVSRETGNAGAFCANRGEITTSKRGQALICATSADGRNRWRHLEDASQVVTRPTD